MSFNRETLLLSQNLLQAMVYYQVQFLRLVEGDWITVGEFDDTTGALLPLSDSAEQLSLEDAQTRLMVLSRKYPFLTFRLNEVIL